MKLPLGGKQQRVNQVAGQKKVVRNEKVPIHLT